MANNNTVKKKKVKMSTGDKVFTVINTIIMILVCIAIVYPLYYVLLASVTDPVVVSSGKILLYPEAWYTNGYETTLKYQPLWTGYANTIKYTVLGTLISLVCTIPAGYALSRYDMVGMPCSEYLRTLIKGFVPKQMPNKDFHDVLQRRYDSDVLNGTAAAHLQHNMGNGSSGSSICLQPDRMPLLL